MNKKTHLLSIALLLFLVGLPLAEAQEQEQAAQETTVESQDPAIQEAFQRGLRLYRNRSFREALAEFNTVAEAQPARADVHYLIGYCHYMLKEFQRSVDAFRRSFEEDPNFDPRTIYQRPGSD